MTDILNNNYYNSEPVDVFFKFGDYGTFLQAKSSYIIDTETFYNLYDIQALYVDNSYLYSSYFDTQMDNANNYLLKMTTNNHCDYNPYAYNIFTNVNELQIGNLSLSSTYLTNEVDFFGNSLNEFNGTFNHAPDFEKLYYGYGNYNIRNVATYNNTPSGLPPYLFQYQYSPSSLYVFGTGDREDLNYDPTYNGLMSINYHNYYPVVEMQQEEYDGLKTNNDISNSSFYHITDTGELKLQNSTFYPMKKLTQAQYDTLTNNNNIDPNTLYIIIEATQSNA